ncbi:hypothetical protein LENED_003911 [Lentinula edodes]|uniref:Uncharacterized protein n=1 Tax=Lentinula edodes TaxID=5353 RepID=A0A1Q3E539_LENED|nr:hypothetical protein LENED_003911 [Lentinula edodes]
MKARKAAAAARKAAEEKAARAAAAREKAAQEARERARRAQQQEERRQLGVRGGPPQVRRQSRRGDPWLRSRKRPVDEDPDGQMQAGKRSSIICKPCHDAKVRCSYSGRPTTVKREGGSNPTGERLAVLESQVAQLLADNRQLRDGQVKANTYHRHFNRKLDWLITDAARRRRTPPELPEAGPSELSKKRRRVMDSDEEEERGRELEMEEDGEGEEEEGGGMEAEGEGEAPAPTAATSEKGKGKGKEIVE